MEDKLKQEAATPANEKRERLNKFLNSTLPNLGQSDLKSQKEVAELEREAKKIDNDNKAQNMELRRSYAKYTFWVVCLWIVSVMAIVVTDGFHYENFDLPQGVLITLLTSTSANIVGFLTIVFTYFFKDGN